MTWLTSSFRWIENTARSVWVDPEGFIGGSAEAVGDHAKDFVNSVAKQASEDATTATPSLSVPRAEIAWSAPAFGLSGRVVKVTDGDTITLLDVSQKQHEVRLYGIDTPEHGQPYGRAAMQALGNLVAGEGVGVDVKGTDSFGRTVGVVYKGNLDVNLKMVRSGYAWWDKKYVPLADDLRVAELHARADGLGLWAEPNPIPPWEWRKTSH